MTDSDTACKCEHEPVDHFSGWGYCQLPGCKCWLFREQFDWVDAMRGREMLPPI